MPKILFRIGIVLIAVSTLLFASLLIIPFLNISTEVKLSVTTIVVIVSEITFWTGGLLVGKEVVTKYKKYFNPLNWFRKNKYIDNNQETSL